jgi:hypothetical protein
MLLVSLIMMASYHHSRKNELDMLPRSLELLKKIKPSFLAL